MVGPWDKEGFISAHPLIPNEGILNGDGECVSDVEIASDVGRGKTDGKLLGIVGVVVGVEELVLFPPGIPVFLDGCGVIGFLH